MLESAKKNLTRKTNPKAILTNERKNAKLNTVKINKQAWFSGRTSASQADCAGSIPVACSKRYGRALVALPYLLEWACESPFHKHRAVKSGSKNCDVTFLWKVCKTEQIPVA